MLQERFGSQRPSLTIAPTTPGDWGSRLKQFAGAIAADVLGLIVASPGLVGISWGHSVGAVVEAIKQQCVPPPRQSRPLRVVPLLGEPPWRGFAGQVGSSTLAHKLEHAINGDSEQEFLSLSGVTPLIPSEIDDKELDIVYKFLEHTTGGYKALIGSRKHKASERPPMADRLDGILTSLSQTGRPLGYEEETLLGHGHLKPRDIANVIGDMCGVVIQSDAPFHQPHILDWRLTGIRRKQLIACSDRARTKRSRGPGVICVAIGANKVEPLLTSIPVVNHLFIDHELAIELEHRLITTSGASE